MKKPKLTEAEKLDAFVAGEADLPEIRFEESIRHLIDSYEGKSGLLSRCILYGLVEPEVSINPHIMASLARSLVEELQQTHKASRAMFPSRLRRAVAWATRDDVQPEFAIMVVQQGLQVATKREVNELSATEEWKAFDHKFNFLFGDLP